jgi:predicted Zn-dependent protease
MLVMLDLRASGADAALARARTLRDKRPGDPVPIILLGDIHMFAHQYDDAAKVYTEAGKLTQDSTLAIKQFEAVRLANRDRPEQSLERWLGLRPDDARARLVLAQYFSSTGRPDRAIAEFEFLARQLPNEAPLLNNLAWLYHEKRDPRAEGLARKAHELAPANPAICDTYGWILLSAKKVDAALPLLKTASETANGDPSVQYHYGAALAAAGRPTEARTALGKALNSSTRFDGRDDAEKLLAQLGKQG